MQALAFVFQARDLELLGLSSPDEKARSLATLDDFWGTFEIAGVALVDMRVWRWMYAHPDATAADLRVATIGIAKDVHLAKRFYDMAAETAPEAVRRRRRRRRRRRSAHKQSL